ncbi:hypothetical protein Ndes2437A_g02507 [Nannochloris sp. 'desiccata']
MSQATQLAVLSAVSVGMWSAKKDQGMWFLIVPRRQLFVFIVADPTNNNTSTAAGKRRRFAPNTANLLKQLGAHSPFSSAIHKEGNCAFAFEVSFENISGIDYQNSLVRPGRLVLEAHNARKREFANIDSAFAYYGGIDGEATRASLETLFGDSSPYKEQRNTSTPWEGALANGGGDGGNGVIGGPNANLSVNAAAAVNTGLPPPPIKRTKTNLLARLGSAVGVVTKSGKATNKNESNFSIRTKSSSSSSSRVVSTTNSITTTDYSTSAITIGHIVRDGDGDNNNEDEDEGNEITSAPTTGTTYNKRDSTHSELFFDQTTSFTSASVSAPGAQPRLAINTACLPPSPRFLFPNPVRSPESSPSPTRSNLFRISHLTGDCLLPPSQLPSQLPSQIPSQLPSQLPQLSPLRSSQQHAPLCSTPAPAASNIYEFRIITIHWTDPQLPEILRPIIEMNEGMLRLYESGLPTWATFFPRAGLYYRPWLRSLTWVLFYAFSFFSLAVGFYDLYKTLPGLQAVLSKMWLPPAAVLQWIEAHAQIRLSILLTYIFGKSEMFLYVVRMIGLAKRTFLEATGPVLSILRPPLQAVWSSGTAPIAALLRTFSNFTSTVLIPPLQALTSTLILPITWFLTMFRHFATVLSSFGGGRGSAVAASSPWLLRAIPTDTIHTLRNSLAIPTRAANSVWRSMNQMVSAFARHQMTWSRRAQRWQISLRKRIAGVFWLVIDAVHVCWTWVWAILKLIVAAGKAGVARQRQEEKEEAERVAASTDAVYLRTIEKKND